MQTSLVHILKEAPVFRASFFLAMLERTVEHASKLEPLNEPSKNVL